LPEFEKYIQNRKRKRRKILKKTNEKKKRNRKKTNRKRRRTDKIQKTANQPRWAAAHSPPQLGLNKFSGGVSLLRVSSPALARGDKWTDPSTW
jgi:hypothetical protein